MKNIIPKLFRWLGRKLPQPQLKVICVFFYVATYTVGVKNTFLITYRLMKEIKLQSHATMQRTNRTKGQTR